VKHGRRGVWRSAPTPASASSNWLLIIDAYSIVSILAGWLFVRRANDGADEDAKPSQAFLHLFACALLSMFNDQLLCTSVEPFSPIAPLFFALPVPCAEMLACYSAHPQHVALLTLLLLLLLLLLVLVA